MINLHKYSFQNIRSFTDKQTIVFDGRDKLIQLDGENRNTGGSSGSGKSTALIALDYLLGFSDIPSTVLQSWITKEPMVVEGFFTIDDIPTVITRSKKNGLHIMYGKEEFQGKLAEEHLQRIIGIPKDVFKQMIHKKQDQRGFFLNKTAKQMYEFLVEMLDLGFYEKKQTKIGEDIKKYVGQATDSANKMESIQNSINELESILSEKTAPEPINDSNLQTLALNVQNIVRVNQSLSHMELQKHEAIKEIKAKELPTKGSFDESKRNQFEIKLNNVRAKFNQLQTQKTNINIEMMSFNSLRTQMISKAQEGVDKSKQLQELLNNQCYTCKQHYSGESALVTKAGLIKQIDDIKQDIVAIRDKVAKEPELEREYKYFTEASNDLSAEIDDLTSSIALEKQAQSQHESKYQEQVDKINAMNRNQELEVTNKWDQAICVLKHELSMSKETVATLQSKKDSYDMAKMTYDSECSSLKSKIEVYKSQHVVQAEILKSADINLKVAEEAHRLIKSYTIQVFQDTLNTIGDIATGMISSIPNIQNSAIYFEGCKENKNGSIKDEVTPVITLNGHNKIPVKAFSGGEKTAIELAVDLAVIDVIEAKAGKGANFFILDEPFNGLDSVCKEACLEVLRQYDTNKKIIMVDHSSELKEMVSDVITVIKDGETSFIA